MLRRSLVIAALLCVLAPAAAAIAQQSPFSPLPPAQQPTQTSTTTGNTSSNNGDTGGLSSWQEILIFLGGVVLIIGIGYAIVTDARKNAPVKDQEIGHIGEPTKPLPKARTKPVRRAKSRAARASRKRNR